MVALFAWANVSLAAGATITSVAFAGTNADLTITISGSDFGSSVPCTACATPDLNIGGHIGCSDVYNIISWIPSSIKVSGIEGNPGSDVLIRVTNPQDKSVGILATAVPKSIRISTPKITSVTFTGSRENLRMKIQGTGFGAAPVGVTLPFDGNLPFFAFIDLPFDAAEWVAGYTNCGYPNLVTLDYESWSNTKIAVSGFGSTYGTGPGRYHHYTVAPGDFVAIAVANSANYGLQMGFDFNFYNPAGTGTVWGGRLP